ncbi:metal-dependent hydrolase [Ilumatobacter nonamiensis]|uniref:metal-dependent hydrolase n=1 Tax=Ilumatobacter nonamiensis TaxID=467093 RepID=UPI000345D45D|nr:metal-dependent hydrolase [Ilumatobacter nonamiensis]
MADLTVRKVKFEFPDELDDVLPGVDPVGESYLVAFSLTMPYLEPYLIRTYRSILDDITDEALAADVRDFIGQEAQHFQNHRRINTIIKGQLGDDVADELQVFEDRLDADYRRFNAERSRRFNLVYAEGFEAMTCAMAMTMFDDAAAGEGMGADGRFGPWQQLWAWHAAEEIEHRTVAFNVYEHLEGNWAYRATGALRAQGHFHRAVDNMQRVLLASQGEPRKHHVPPWLRNGRSRYLRTFRPGYDPGALEQNPLVDTILAGYAA